MVPRTVRLRSLYSVGECVEGCEKSTERRWQIRAPRSWPPRITFRGDDEDLVSKTEARTSRRAVPTERFVLLEASPMMGVDMP